MYNPEANFNTLFSEFLKSFIFKEIKLNVYNIAT
jgi:hypothetical protein